MSGISDQLHIYNSLKGKKEQFKPVNEGFVGLYVCGPTVYSNTHLGNCRSFVSFDMVNRYLRHLGYKVRYVRNITDVGHLVDDADEGEDKIGKIARLQKLEPMEIVQKYTVDFHKVMEQFNALPPNIEPTATGHIIEQIDMIQAILDNELQHVIANVPSVVGFLTTGDQPTPLRPDEMNRILGKVDEAREMGEQPEIPFKVGDAIKVVDGPFNNFTGFVEEVYPDKMKVKVMVYIFGRKTPLELDYLQVEHEE